MTGKEGKIYFCPHHPEIVSDKPGRCPKDGLELVLKKRAREGGDHEHHGSHQSHAEHHKMMARDFKRRFWYSFGVSIPILALSPVIQNWLGFSLDFPGRGTVLFLLASFVALWGAWPFYKEAVTSELKEGRLGMMVLVSIAVGVGYFYSAATTFFIEAPGFYWEIATLVVVLLLGHWMEMRAVIGASGALGELVKLIPLKAHLKKQDDIKDVKTESLKAGDIILIRPGEKVPIDGEVKEGRGSVNESLITGEAKPVLKKAGSKVIGGSLNIDGALTVRVTKTGKDTALSQIIQLVQEAQESKPATQKLADRAAHYLTLIAIFVGLGTFLFWMFIAGQTLIFALTLTITVVVITCPHALGLAIPTVTTIATSLSAKNGILVQDMEAVEKAKDLDYVVFDKTGTLTKGIFAVADIKSLDERYAKKDILKIAGGLDINSEHLIGKSIVKKAKEENIAIEPAGEYKALPGQGASGKLDGKKIVVGNESAAKETKNFHQARKVAFNFAGQGKTVVYVASEGRVIGLITLFDEIREEAKEAIRWFKDRDIKVAMMTGDNQKVAAYVADNLELDSYFAEVMPGEKSDKIAELQKGGRTVMMVGDGINDAPALTRANIAVAIGAGTDVAIESAQVVLVQNNPLDVVKLMILSEKTMSKMIQNLTWAVGYNVIAIPIAAGVLFRWGILLRPEWGALAMSASSVIVVLNALFLKKINLKDF